MEELEHKVHIVSLKKNSKIVLKDYELNLLEQIMIHRWMAAKSIHQFIQKSAPKKLHPNSISNRLKKLIDKGILLRRTKNISTTRAVVNQYFYLLTLEAYRVLVERKFITHREAKRNYRQAMEMGLPSSHDAAMSFLANQIVVKCNVPKRIKGLSHSRGEDNPIVVGDATSQIEIRNLVIPDWVFQLDSHIICLEMDTGSQNQKVIQNKILKYEKLKQILLIKGIKLDVFFTVLDSTVDRFNEGRLDNRSKRVKYIKNTISKTLHSRSNYYVASASRAPDIIDHWLTEISN